MTAVRFINSRATRASMRLLAIVFASAALAVPAHAQVPAQYVFDQLKDTASSFIEPDGSCGYLLTANASPQQQAQPRAKRNRNMVQAKAVVAQATPAAHSEEIDLEKYKDPVFPEPAELQNLGMRLVLVTAGVLAACVISLIVAKRCFGVGRIAKAGDATMRVLETLPLSNRCHLQLIQADGHKVLVGVDASGLKSVLLLQDPFREALDSLEVESAPQHESKTIAPEAPKRNNLTGASGSVFQTSLSELGKFPAFSSEQK